MGDYIERQAVIDAIGKEMQKPQTPDFKGVRDYEVHIACEAFSDAAMIVEDLQAARVREDVNGNPILRYRPERYERYEEYGLNEKGEMLYLKRIIIDEKSYAMYCPCCGKRLCSRFVNFCPNCGARMTEE